MLLAEEVLLLWVEGRGGEDRAPAAATPFSVGTSSGRHDLGAEVGRELVRRGHGSGHHWVQRKETGLWVRGTLTPAPFFRVPAG